MAVYSNQKKTKKTKKTQRKSIALDLFIGGGGISRELEIAKFEWLAAVAIDPKYNHIEKKLLIIPPIF